MLGIFAVRSCALGLTLVWLFCVLDFGGVLVLFLKFVPFGCLGWCFVCFGFNVCDLEFCVESVLDNLCLYV